MRKAMLFLAVFGLVGSLWAAEPSVGTWKVNIAKSKDPGLKALTLVKRELNGEQFEITETGTQADDSRISEKFTHPQKGGVVHSLSAPTEGELTVVTLIGPGDFFVTILQKGMQVQVQHVLVSKDGRSMQITTKGTDDKGKPFERLLAYERQ
jgi:hypothetical protein